MSQKFNILFIFLLFSSSVSTWAQSSNSSDGLNVNSPYSRIGIGDLAPIGTIRNIGMGGTGVSFGHPEFINSINPALLLNNRTRRYDSLFTILEASAMGQIRRVSNNATGENSGNVNFSSFAYLFPVSKNWTTSIGIRPFSNVNYSIFQQNLVNNSPSDTVNILYTGSGGIYQADFANGLRINKYVNIGLQISYLFGRINNESLSEITTQPDPVVVGTQEKTSYTGFMFRPGISYRKRIQNVHPDSAIFINAGFTYDFFGNMEADQDLLIVRRTQFNTVISQNRIQSNNTSINFPSTYRAGVSFSKHQAWNIGADFSYSGWSDYKGPGTAANDTLKNSFTISVGGEFALNPANPNSDKDLKKNYLRAGISYTKTPIYINGNQISDLSVSIGYTLPMGRKRSYGLPLPKVNAALVVGQRGTLQDSLVKDMYFKLYLGLTINDRWFIKRRID
jgi:hypothetical protein